MIRWQNAGALWALSLVALPIAVHLLRAHRADRVLFPSVRFVPPARTAAVRLRTPTDWLLLVLRASVIALAVAATAGPTLMTSNRLDAWNSRTARAVLVDTSDSLRAPDADGVAPEQPAEIAAAAELTSATYGRRFDSPNLPAGLARSVAWLSASPPARREIVVISDFQRGALDRQATLSIPSDIGVRFVPVGGARRTRVVPGMELLGVDEVPARAHSLELTPDSTAVVLEARPRASTTAGIRVVNAPAAGQSLLRILAEAGTPTGSAEQPLAIQFTSGESTNRSAELTAVSSGWMLRTVLRLSSDRSLLASARSVTTAGSTGDSPAGPWTIILRDRRQMPLVRAAAARSELLLDVGAPPESLFAAAVVRAALIARRGESDLAEQEVGRIDASRLAAWSRPPASVDRQAHTSYASVHGRDAWIGVESTDARWFWAVALMLLAVEQWLRARPARRGREDATRAAA
jgi:hypothetical protein